jgi:DNA-binding Xre family transcriptional regulator
MYKSKVKYLAALKNKSYSVISKELGIDTNFCTRLANGKITNCNLETLKKLKHYFECSLEDLIDFNVNSDSNSLNLKTVDNKEEYNLNISSKKKL